MVLQTRNWKPLVSRLAQLALLVVFASLLTGCRGTLYEDNIKVPGTASGVPLLWFMQDALFFGLFGPATTLVMVWALLPVIFPPAHRLRSHGKTVEIWVSRRKFPWIAFPKAVLVPVAPDLKMVFGAAKIVRDWGANAVQREAEEVAPLQPGEAFVGTGSKFRWGHTALAVIFDEQKRTNPEIMAAALNSGLKQLAHEGVTSVLLPDMTDNLLQQPNWITDAQRSNVAHATARLMLDAILLSDGVKHIKIWVFDPRNAEVFAEVMQAIEDEEDTASKGATHTAHA